MSLRCLEQNKDIISKAGEFIVKGAYGCIRAWPDGNRKPNAEQYQEPTYWVDATYLAADSRTPIHIREQGLRQSTVYCLCTGVCVGESALNSQLIDKLNQWFNLSR